MTRPANSALTRLPRIDDLVAAAGTIVTTYGRGPATTALRAAVDDARSTLLAGGAAATDPGALIADAEARLQQRRPGPPRRVLNATGVVVHTNLGRAPLSAEAIAAMTAAAGYCDLEYDLATGGRGSRGARLDPLLAEATGAEAGIAVNNAAAALVLVLTALSSGRSVPVSRGELVEIGGSFRLPDIMAASGAKLVEVGTTNRTRAADYAAVDDPALLLMVHPSNYEVTGFVESPSVAALAAVARDKGVPLVHDVGSGLLDDRTEAWCVAEPTIGGSLRDGADLVIASGDKLLGGPQAGLLVGRRDLVDRCRRHPLARALRLDKLRIAALVATLEAHLRDGGAPPGIPIWTMLQAQAGPLLSRAQALAARVGGVVGEGLSPIGGGSAPGAGVIGPVVVVTTAHANDAARALRDADPPIIVRVADDALVIDLRTVAPTDDDLLAAAVTSAIAT